MRVLVCFAPCRLKVQKVGSLHVFGLLFSDAGGYGIRRASITSPVPSSTVGCETVYESIAPVFRVHGVLRVFFKNY
jgi:hypothetical protein